MTPAQMANLHRASFARGWSEAEIADLIGRPTTEVVTTPYGFAILQIIVPEAELLTIAVDPKAREEGHGSTLLKKVLKQATARGAETLFLEVDATNAPALALYQRAGFEQSGRRAEYYAQADGTRSDAILMSLSLSAQPEGK